MKSYDYQQYWSNHFECQEPHEQEAKLLIDFIKQFHFHSVLELGSGQGHLSKKLKENFDIYLTGLDLISDNECLDSFIKIDVCKFTPAKIYDLIVTRNFLMHIKPHDIDRVLSNLIGKSKHFVAVEYVPITPKPLSPHNFAHNYEGLGQTRINNERVILSA